jgi:glycosyltransferase involved in cell wall biosynthesis
MSVGHDVVPRVTVVVIFLNAERFIAEAVESVFRQTFDGWELLLVDDGSTDRSTTMAREYAAGRPRQVRYLEHPGHANRGMSASRNLGLEHARGEYVAFLDSDDVYLPWRLAEHIAILDVMPSVDMVQGDCVKWHSWAPAGRRADDDAAWPFPCIGDRMLRPPEGLLTSLALRDVYVGICSVTVRRAAALAVGGFEEQFRTFYEDEVFLSKIYLEKIVYAQNRYVAKYRIHPDSSCGRVGSTTHLAAGPSRTAGRAFRAWLRDYVQRKGARHPVLDELLAAALDEDARGTRRTSSALLREAGARVRRYADRTTRVLLPSSRYQSLRRWRRDVAGRRVDRRYEELCRRISAAELGRSGRSGGQPGRA